MFNKFPDKTLKLGRNDKCSCGSGRKYKHCCLNTNSLMGSLNQSIEIVFSPGVFSYENIHYASISCSIGKNEPHKLFVNKSRQFDNEKEAGDSSINDISSAYSDSVRSDSEAKIEEFLCSLGYVNTESFQSIEQFFSSKT